MICESRDLSGAVEHGWLEEEAEEEDEDLTEESSSDDENLEDRSSKESARSVVLSRFLTKLMDPIHPLKYSKSLPSLAHTIANSEGERMRKEGFLTEGWLLERCVEGTPGRKYNMSGLIVDSDAILASQMQKDRMGRELFNEDSDGVDAEDSASQCNDTVPQNSIYTSLYVIILFLAAYGLWCLVACLTAPWLKPKFRSLRRR